MNNNSLATQIATIITFILSVGGIIAEIKTTGTLAPTHVESVAMTIAATVTAVSSIVAFFTHRTAVQTALNTPVPTDVPADATLTTPASTDTVSQ